jgi:uncharacterized protein YndB with AHSA1/START domain
MTNAPKRGDARAIADVGAGMLLATVDIAAPAERVFRALTSAELVEWWGSPDTYRTTRWTGDLRVGGAWSTDGIGSDGKPFSVSGEFLEIDPPRKLVQTWRAGWDGNSVTTITYRLEALADGGTRITVRHEGFGDRAEACEGHALGWSRVLGWLSDHFVPAARAAGGARP